MSADFSEVIYCFRWNARRRRAGVPMTPEEALQNYTSGEEFTAALMPEPPGVHPVLVTCTWKSGYASATFLDDLGRTRAKYVFNREDEKWLFLSAVFLWEYADEDPSLTTIEAVKYEKFSFRVDGAVEHVQVDKPNNAKDMTEYSDVPVQGNWEPLPDFGDWGSMSRFER